MKTSPEVTREDLQCADGIKAKSSYFKGSMITTVLISSVYIYKVESNKKNEKALIEMVSTPDSH